LYFCIQGLAAREVRRMNIPTA